MAHLDFQSMKDQMQQEIEGMKARGMKPAEIRIGNPYTLYWKSRILEADQIEMAQRKTFADIPIITDSSMPADRVAVVFWNVAGLRDRIVIYGLMVED